MYVKILMSKPSQMYTKYSFGEVQLEIADGVSFESPAGWFIAAVEIHEGTAVNPGELVITDGIEL